MLHLNIIKPDDILILNNNRPIIFDSLPVERKWRNAGGKPKIFNIIIYNNYKLVKCTYAYVLLCEHKGCKNLALWSHSMCSHHSKGFEIYSYCLDDYCMVSPLYGLEYGKALYCTTHKLKGMIDVKHPLCIYPNCTKRCNFSRNGEKAQYCADHKMSDMIDVNNIKCIHEGCNIRASQGFNNGRPLYCLTHKLDGMLNVVSKRCEHLNCEILASFGVENEGRKYCAKHKLPGMIYLIQDFCSHNGCSKLPCYGLKGGKREYCVDHKLSNMINIKCNLCVYPDCNIIPSFGPPGGNPTYCSKHKTENMINLINKKCRYPNCEVRPSFGLKDDKPTFCKKHKTEFMIDVIHKRCNEDQCLSRAKYGIIGKNPDFCAKHKKDFMSNLVSYKCHYDLCEIRPSYRKLFSKHSIHCVEHATLNEYSISKSQPKCTFICCENDAYFVSDMDKYFYPVRCRIHSLSNDIELLYKQCQKCGDELYFPFDKEICFECGKYRDRRLYYFKELKMKYFLESNNIQHIHNKPISSKGSRCRPDFLIKSLFGYIVLEVDEHQHREYSAENEISRTKTLYSDIQLLNFGSEVLFIRFNPDNYLGLQHTLRERYEYFYRILMYLINLPTIGTNQIPGKLTLYYDGFNGNPKIELLY